MLCTTLLKCQGSHCTGYFLHYCFSIGIYESPNGLKFNVGYIIDARNFSRVHIRKKRQLFNQFETVQQHYDLFESNSVAEEILNGNTEIFREKHLTR